MEDSKYTKSVAGHAAYHFESKSRYHEYDHDIMYDIFGAIYLCKSDDEEFMTDFYDYLRDFAAENEDFREALINTAIMTKEEIDGLSDDEWGTVLGCDFTTEQEPKE